MDGDNVYINKIPADDDIDNVNEAINNKIVSVNMEKIYEMVTETEA